MAGTRGSADPSTLRSPMEQALKEAVERTELALTAANMGIWSLDIALQTVTVDERARAFWGLPAGVSTLSVSELERVDPATRATMATDRTTKGPRS